MHVTVTIPPGLTNRQKVLVARGYLGGVVTANRVLIRAGRVPALYSSGVVYKAEPKGVESFVDALTTLARGHGDCAHLAAWRVAELLEQGEPASLRLYMRPARRAVHVQVRRGDGRIEDPSRFLGMSPNRE